MAQTKVKKELIDGSLGTDWQSATKTADFTAVIGQGYFVDTSSNIVVVSLPAGTSGDEIHFTDYAGTFDTNKIKFVASSSPSQQKIQGGTDPAKNTTENAFVKLVYQNDTKGWTAFNLTADPNLVTSVYYLVVAGGGGTRSDGPGGGGAGGYLTNYGGTAITLTPSSNYSIYVGPGGAAASSGTDSHFTGTGASFTSNGGGRGGGAPGGSGNVNYPGVSGGSGGGGAGGLYGAGGGSATPAGQGNAGGSSGICCGTNYGGGGGGGAGAAGATPSNSGQPAGNGGVGLANLILNVANAQSAVVGEVSGGTVYYAGGGGGTGASSHGAGGTGGGATGTTGANAGTPNTGGGGAGINATGGSGVVILRYPSDSTITNPGGGLSFSTYQETTTTTNDTNVTVFKSGTGNIQFS